VSALASRGSLAQVEVQGQPGVTGQLGLGTSDAPQLRLLRGDAGGSDVTNVRLAAAKIGAQLELAHVLDDTRGTRGHRADLWAGYPGGESGASLELHGAGAAIIAHTTPRAGEPRLEITTGDKRAWSAP
jgi:hypothetical protein